MSDLYKKDGIGMFSDIELHFLENRFKLVKRMSFRAGTVEDAEDVVQEAYLRALKYCKSFNGENLDRWINNILNNALKDLKNAQKGYSAIELEEEHEGSSEPPHYPRHIMREIYRMIRHRPIAQVEILMMYFQHEYSAKEISELTDFSYAQCQKTVFRFKEELKEIYG